MTLLTAQDRARLLANGVLRRHAEQDDPDLSIDFLPVVKLFTPDAGCTWLLTELDPNYTDRAFGLCDLGLGFPEPGYVSLSELSQLRGPLNLPVERDLYFVPAKPVSGYAKERTFPVVGPEITTAEKSRYLNSVRSKLRDHAEAMMPLRHSPVTHLAATTPGRVWLQTRQEAPRGLRWIVASLRGLLDGRATVPAVRVALPRGFKVFEEAEGLVWGVFTDDLGVERVQTYAVDGPLPPSCEGD